MTSQQQRRATAKTVILKWFDDGKTSPSLRHTFSRDIDTFFETIAKRSTWHETLTILLADQGQANFKMSGVGWSARPSSKGLVVTSVVPAWNIGWRRVLSNEFSDHNLSWIGHYARQYIHRSNVAKVLMASWERNNLILHPFGEALSLRRYCDDASHPTVSEMLKKAEVGAIEDWNITWKKDADTYRSKWIHRNTFEPAIHQGIFHFLRAQSLAASEFELEALGAFDCVLHSIQSMSWSTHLGNPHRSRRDLCKVLGFGKASQDLSEHIYFLRNQFKAHAGGWRWWDYGEHFGDDLVGEASRLNSRAIRKAADLEPSIRRIEPQSHNWADWLEEHFPILWRAFWFKEPPLQ